MTRFGMLASILTTLLLSGVTYLALRSPPRAAPVIPARGLLADPTSLQELEVRWSRGGFALLSRGPIPGTWNVRVNDHADAPEVIWPATPDAVRSLAHVLAEALPGAAPARSRPGSETLVTIRSLDGSRVIVSFDDARLAGRGLALARFVAGVAAAEIAPAVAITLDDAVLSLFRQESVRGWLRTSPLAGADGSPSRIDLDSPGFGATLARVGQDWSLARPVAWRAEGGAAQAVADALGAAGRPLTTIRASDPALGIGEGSPRARVEAHVRVSEATGVARLTLAHDIRFGRATPGGGVYAVVSAELRGEEPPRRVASWGPLVFELDPAMLARIPADAGVLLSRIAAPLPGADVRRVRVEALGGGGGARSAVFTRVEGRWRDDAGNPGPEGLEALVHALCDVPGERATIEPELTAEGPGTAVLPEARVHLSDAPDRDAVALEVMGLSPTADGTPRVAIRAGRVRIEYSGEKARAILGVFGALAPR